MKKNILIIILFAAIQLSAQTVEKDYSKSKFEFGFFTGITSERMEYFGESFMVEARYKIDSKWIVKLSVGNSKLIKEDYSRETYYNPYYDSLHSFTNFLKGYIFEIVPASLGVEYMILGERTIPYLIGELGFNSYTTNKVIGYIMKNDYTPRDPNQIDFIGQYPRHSYYYNGTSIRIALGVGLKQITASFLNLDIRYLFQFNTHLTNSHLLLVGVNLLQ
jgi:hypothetical protein